jgi:PAS domain S-box-containing protein
MPPTAGTSVSQFGEQDTEHLRDLVESVSDLIQIVQPNGSFLYVNRAWRDALGYTPEDVAKLSVCDILHPSDRARGAELFRRVLAGENLQRIEVTFVAKDGRAIVVEGSVSCRCENGRPVAARGIYRDITERKRAEQGLRESEETWRTIAANVPGIICTMDREGTILFINKVLPGYDHDRVIGTKTYDYIAPEYHARLREGLAALFERGESFDIDVVAAGSPGETRHYHVRHSPVRRAGQVVAALSIGTDVTLGKQAEAELRAREMLLRHLFESSPDAIVVKDLTGKVLHVNEAACRLHGLSREQLVGRNSVDLVPPDQRARVVAGFPKLASGQVEHFQGFAWTSDSRAVPVELRSKRVDYAGQPALLMHIRDITERKQAEAEHRRLEAQMLHAQKLESLGVLAGGIAHDFNNLLTAMLGYASLARLQLAPGTPVLAMLQEIENAAQRAADLASQMLAYSGKGRFVVRVFRVDALVQEMTKLLETVVSKKAVIHMDLAPVTIEGDATQIRQVVMNLITNASDALGGQNGVISVRTRVRHAGAADLRSTIVPHELPEGEYVWVEVEDSGCGMSPEVVARIFDPFFTTKFTGRGLGLAAVLGIVRGHRGTIKVASTPGRGTAVQLLFPSSRALPVETAAPVAPDDGRAPERGALLVVDDEEQVRTFARRVLEGAGFSVLVAADGHEALAILTARRPGIQALVLDLTMPRMDGLDVLRQMAQRGIRLPVLLMSGYSEQEASSRVAGLGVRGFMQKPFRPVDLLGRVNELLRSAPSGS